MREYTFGRQTEDYLLTYRQKTKMTSILSMNDIGTLDRQIAQLQDYKPIPENEVKQLCDKVSPWQSCMQALTTQAASLILRHLSSKLFKFLRQLLNFRTMFLSLKKTSGQMIRAGWN